MGGGSSKESKTAAQDRRDRALLARLASARASGDVSGTLAIMEELFRPLWQSVQARAALTLRSARVQRDDLDDIVAATITRLLVALADGHDFGETPFRLVIAENVRFAVLDFKRAQAERAGREELRSPATMPELPAAATLGPVEQADTLRSMLLSLSDRDRSIVIEREVVGVPVKLVARRHQMSPDAVRQACSRALARLRHAADSDVAGSSKPSKLRRAYQ
ncbi:MAG: RNA polymerase sigma factor [Solirubrobacteraceae bacterium]